MKKRNFPNTYVIVFALILLSALATWLVPAGSFEMKKMLVNGVERDVVVQNSFHATESNPQSWEVFSAIFDGFVDKADIIVFILLIGASFYIINLSRALDAGILKFLSSAQKLERFRFIRVLGIHNILITSVMLMFSVFGSVFGMSEETIAFVIIFVPLAIKMGYDSIVGVSMCFVGATLGFIGALMNPFTIGVAQGIAQLPLFSGMEYRFIIWIIINIIGIAYVLRYAARVRRRPERSLMYEEDQYWRDKAAENESIPTQKNTLSSYISFIIVSVSLFIFAICFPFTNIVVGSLSLTFPALPILCAIFVLFGFYLVVRRSVQAYVLFLMLFTILALIVGVLGYQWYIREIAALFFAMGLFAGIALRYGANEMVKHFLDGAKDIASAAFIVGLAGGIIIILQNGGIIDSMLNSISGLINSENKMGSVSGMYTVQTLINLIMPSGSAKAALTMPIMAPFSDIIGVSRQATVVAFQLGDGFTNMITPVSGVLLGVLSMARIPYQKWVKWVWPMILLLFLVGFLLLIPTVYMELPGF